MNETDQTKRSLIRARDLSLGGLFGALAIAFPIVFHMFGPALGPIFLPMYLPVLAAGLLISPGVAVWVGLLSPLLSFALTGMPPIAPVPTAIMMSLELAALAGVAGLLYQKLKWNIWLSIIGAMIASHLVFALELATIAPLLGFHPPFLAYLGAALLRGLPGTALQLTVVPAAVAAVKKVGMIRHERE